MGGGELEDAGNAADLTEGGEEVFDIIYDNWPFLLNYRPDMKPTVTVPDERCV